MSTLTVPDSLKMLRETFCIAQSAIQHRPYDDARKPEHVARLGRLIEDIDRQRPLGSDGKHGERHTATCGCEDVARTPGTITRRRYATRAELAERMAERMRGENDMDSTWEDHALAALDALAELHVPVDALVKIIVEEEI